MSKPFPRVRDAYPLVAVQRPSCRQSWTVVTDGEADSAIVAPRLDRNRSVCRTRGRAVLDRVFNQRLQNERRDQRVLHLRIEVHRDIEPVLEPHCL